MNVIVYKDYEDYVEKSNSLNARCLSWPNESPKDKHGNHTGGFLMVSEGAYKSLVDFFIPIAKNMLRRT